MPDSFTEMGHLSAALMPNDPERLLFFFSKVRKGLALFRRLPYA